MSYDDQKGLRFETGLMVIMVLFMLAIGGIAVYHSIDERIERIEDRLFKESAPASVGDDGR